MKNIDLSYLNEISGGDKAFIREMLELFIHTTSVEVYQFDSLLQANAIDQIGSLAHKMKAPIQMLGANELFELIRSVEKSGKEHSNLELLPEKINDVKRKVEELSQEIKEILAES